MERRRPDGLGDARGDRLTQGCERARRLARHAVEAAVTHPPRGRVGACHRRSRAADARCTAVAVVAGVGWVPVSTLLVVMAVAVIGGTWPALAGVVFAVLTREFSFVSPAEMPGIDLRPNPVSLIGFTVAGAAVSILIGKLVQLAEEQAALRRVATLVAHAAPADELFAAVTEEVRRLVVVDFVRVARCDTDDSLTAVATWSRTGEQFPVGSRWPLAGALAMSVLRTGRSARVDSIAGASGPLAIDAREHGIRSATAVPIIVEATSGEWCSPDRDGNGRRRPVPRRASPASRTCWRRRSRTSTVAPGSPGLPGAGGAAAGRDAGGAQGAGGGVFAAVNEEAGQLLETDQTTMIRYGSNGTSTIVASWRRTGEAVPPVGVRGRLGGKNLTTIISQTRRPARVDSYADATGDVAEAARAP
jgi:Domain of unknown function (DUF4118)/GAF domain